MFLVNLWNSAEGARWPSGLARVAICSTSAIFFAAASVAPAAAEEIDELKSEMRQLLDRIDNLEQNQQQTQIEVDQIEANSAWLVNERPVRARATVIGPLTSQGEYVSGGDFPGSFKLPGSDSSMAIYGFIKADFIHNFGVHRSFGPQLAVPGLQPAKGAAGSGIQGQTNFRFNPSQFNIETRTPSEYGEIRTHVQFDWFETDFDGGPNNSTVNEIRNGLRLAQASIGPWTFGQQWTAFTDLSQYAETADWENLNSAPICRCPSITYADSLGGGWSFAVSIVDPVTQIETDAGGFDVFKSEDSDAVDSSGVPLDTITSQNALVLVNRGMPDIQANIKYAQDWGHLFASAQVRRIGYDVDFAANEDAGSQFLAATGKSSDTATGWGFTLGLNLNDPFGLHPRDRFYTNATYGEGIRGIIDNSLFCFTPLSGGGGCVLEATVDGVTGELEVNSNMGFMAHYQHWWTDTIRSTIIYGLTRNSPGADFDREGTLRRTQYAVANLWWSPLARVNLGIETQYIEAKFKSDGPNEPDANESVQVQFSAVVLW